jgi:phosphopantetheine binding protein
MVESKKAIAGSERPETAGEHAIYVAPRSDLEDLLCQMWADVLAVDRVGVHDDFFDLGGHSQLLVRLQLKISNLLQRDVPVTALFEHRTIDLLANYLNSAEDAA